MKKMIFILLFSLTFHVKAGLFNNCSSGTDPLHISVQATELYPRYFTVKDTIENELDQISSYSHVTILKKEIESLSVQLKRLRGLYKNCANKKAEQYFIQRVASAEFLGMERISGGYSEVANRKEQFKKFEKWEYENTWITPVSQLSSLGDFFESFDLLKANFETLMPELEKQIENEDNTAKKQLEEKKQESIRLDEKIRKEKERIAEEKRLYQELLEKDRELNKLKNQKVRNNIKSNAAESNTPSSKDTSYETIATMINFNGFLCAKVVKVTELRQEDIYEVECILYRGGSSTQAYIANGNTGVVYTP